MEACLGITTCDKCGKPMKKGQPVLIVAEGNATESVRSQISKALVFAMLVTLIAGTVLEKRDEQRLSNIPNAVGLKLVGNHIFY